MQRGFHDVDYHSGRPFVGTDRAVTVTPNAVTWSTDPFDVNANANALRWGTLYNFRFDTNVPPAPPGRGRLLPIPAPLFRLRVQRGARALHRFDRRDEL